MRRKANLIHGVADGTGATANDSWYYSNRRQLETRKGPNQVEDDSWKPRIASVHGVRVQDHGCNDTKAQL
jgi:hypothetical protein